MNREFPSECKLEPSLRHYLDEHPNGTEILTVLIRLTVKEPPANWSQLEWKSRPYLTPPTGQTIWSVKVPQSQLLSLAASPEVGAIGGWTTLSTM